MGEGVLENGGADRWVALAEHVLDDAGLGRTPIELTVHFVDEPEMADTLGMPLPSFAAVNEEE